MILPAGRLVPCLRSSQLLAEQDGDVVAFLIGGDDILPVAIPRTYGLVVNVRETIGRSPRAFHIGQSIVMMRKHRLPTLGSGVLFELRLSPRFRGQ